MPRLTILIIGTFAAGCAAVPVEPALWPQGLPPRAYYEAAWEADAKNREMEAFEDYLTWVVRFYRGTALALGWTGLQDKMTADLEADEAKLLAPRLACLGQMVSCEWAKHNERRRVTSDMLRTWARVLSQAKGQGRALSAADRLIADVTALLKGELEPGAISVERYREAIAAASP